MPQNRSERRAKQHVVEKVTPTIAAQDGGGDRYRMRIISAGDGSSATYPGDVLERDAAAAWPVGTRMRANHDGWLDFGGDVTRLMGKTTTAAEWDATEQASFAEFQVGSQWSEWFRDFADVIGVSISASAEVQWPDEGDGDVDYTNELLPVVTRILPMTEAPYNSIDFVEAPGANGRIVAALEALRDLAHDKFKIAETSRLDAEIRERRGTPESRVTTEEDIEMDEQTLRSILAEERAATVAAVEAKVVEATTPVETAPEKPTVKATTEAIVAAGLTEDGRDAVYEAIEAGGKTLDEAIAREKAREDKMRAEITAAVEAKAASESVQYGFVTEAHKQGDVSEVGDDFDALIEGIEAAAGRGTVKH